MFAAVLYLTSARVTGRRCPSVLREGTAITTTSSCGQATGRRCPSVLREGTAITTTSSYERATGRLCGFSLRGGAAAPIARWGANHIAPKCIVPTWAGNKRQLGKTQI